MWVKVDDALPDHPKVLDAGLQLGSNGVGRVLAIWLKGMCYCNHNLTDGVISERILKSWTVVDRRPLDVASVMVMAGIFDKVDHGYRFHDYTDYQPSKAEVTAKRKKDLERKKRRPVETDSTQNPTGFHAESVVVPATPARPGLSIGTHQEDHRALRGRFPQAVENLRVLKALVWREVHAAYDDPSEEFTYSNVLERLKVAAARAKLVYSSEFFHGQVEVAMTRVPLQRGRRRAA